ncbi:hypothetical protein HPB49_011263 [Dermacentor silvarum]|uniref:Uncharacterized protein n=1 Tax=Dermacentor silvarum TaxID=543639 RepID=A0ACB8CEW1_DERSI|nr:hypothetical protein HPB49_011263 [Dermacentor silvarum]
MIFSQVMAAEIYRTIGGVFLPKHFSDEAVLSTLAYRPQPGDLFIVSYPKCGTTWMQNIVYNILMDAEEPKDFLQQALQLPFLEMQGAEAAVYAPKPAAFKTHLSFQKNPYSPEAKYIYIARNPYDCCVSFYYHTKNIPLYQFENGTFDEFFEIFLQGRVDFGDYFENVLSCTTTAIGVFQGPKVPNFVRYGVTLIPCRLCSKQIDVCQQCGRVGRRKDVCPTPTIKTFLACRTSEPQGRPSLYPKIPNVQGDIQDPLRSVQSTMGALTGRTPAAVGERFPATRQAASYVKVKDPIGEPRAKIQRQQLLQEKPQQENVTIACEKPTRPLRQENAALRTTINNLSREITEIPSRETHAKHKKDRGNNHNTQETAVEEPALKKRALKATRKQTENDRIDNLETKFEARFTELEQLITANSAAVTAMKQTLETYQAENTNRFAYIERTLQPIVSHPTFAPLFAHIHSTREPRTRQRNHGRQRNSSSRHNSMAVELGHKGPPHGGGLCTLVMKGLTFVEQEPQSNINVEHTLTEIIPGKKRKGSIFQLNVYSNSSQRKQRFKTLLHRASTAADRNTLIARINDKYLPTTPTEQHVPYGGLPNAKLDCVIDVEEAAAKSYDQDQQLWAIQQVLGALETQEPSEPAMASGQPRRVTATS